MTMQKNWMNRLAGAMVALGLLAACEKHDAAAGQAAGALSNVASQAGQKFDQAENYVGQQVDSVKQSAQQNLQSAGTLPDMSASGVAAAARQSGGRGKRDKRGYHQRRKRYRCGPAVRRAQIAGLVGKLSYESKRGERSIGNRFGQFFERCIEWFGRHLSRPRQRPLDMDK